MNDLCESMIPIRPFLKWPGGKRWLIERKLVKFPAHTKRYIEPFLGGGAVYFGIASGTAILADSNSRLIETYRAVRDGYRVVERRLVEYQDLHCKEFYYLERARSYKNRFQRAAQFIYLNRTCFNGMYRVNKKGEFNVPLGTKTGVLLGDDFRAISRTLRSAELRVSDFEETVGLASEGDLLFADPPYTVKHNKNGFLKYNENIFSWDDQVRLKDALVAAQQRGASVICTNADHESIRELYEPHFSISGIKRLSVLAAKSNARSAVSEVIISNIPKEINWTGTY